jgi:hypothetical protein
MALTIKDVAAERREVTWDYDGNPIRLVYNPARYTPLLEDEMAAASDTEAFQARTLVVFLSALLIEWEGLVEDDGVTPVPLWRTIDGERVSTLRQLPAKFLADMAEVIANDNAGARAEGKDSDAGSPQVVDMANARAGTG